MGWIDSLSTSPAQIIATGISATISTELIEAPILGMPLANNTGGMIVPNKASMPVHLRNEMPIGMLPANARQFIINITAAAPLTIIALLFIAGTSLPALLLATI